MSEEKQIYNIDVINFGISLAILYVARFIAFTWSETKEQYFIDNPTKLPGVPTFIGIFLIGPFVLFAFYLGLQSTGNLMYQVYMKNKGNSTEHLH